MGERHRSKNKGSKGSTPSFDTFCGTAAKLPNLCASDLSLHLLLLNTLSASAPHGQNRLPVHIQTKPNKTQSQCCVCKPQ